MKCRRDGSGRTTLWCGAMVQGGNVVRHIFEIGNAKYQLNKNAISEFILEVRHQNPVYCPGFASEEVGDAKSQAEEALDGIFREVMQLYNDYARTENLDTLMKLKTKLEQVSLRYRSVALAEEVMSINCCLPYERRLQGADPSGESGDQ